VKRARKRNKVEKGNLNGKGITSLGGAYKIINAGLVTDWPKPLN